MLRAMAFFGLAAAAFAGEKLDLLVNAASSFSATIQQQLEMLKSNPSPMECAEKTIDYAAAKTAYFKALRDELPEIMKIASGKEERPPELDTFAAAFAVAGEEQEKAADEETLVLLKRFPSNPEVEKARVEFERAQKVEERFHKDFDGVDLTGNYLPDKGLSFNPARNKSSSPGPRGDIYRVGTFARVWVSNLQGSQESLSGHLARDQIFLKVRNIFRLAIQRASYEFVAHRVAHFSTFKPPLFFAEPSPLRFPAKQKTMLFDHPSFRHPRIRPSRDT
jgi:hypothetical protein